MHRSLVRNRLPVTYLMIGTALSAAYFVVPTSADAQHAIYQAIGLSAVFAIWFGNKRHRSGRAWSAILAGIALWVGGDSYWNAYHWLTGREAPFPSAADVLYLLAYLPLLLGIVLLVRGGRPRTSDLVDASIIGLAAGLIVWFTAIAPSAHAHQSSSLTAAVTVIYPTMDYLLLVGIVQLFFVGGLRNASLRWVTLAFATVLVTDIIYARMRVDSTFTATSYVNVGYFAFYVLLGVAALSPSVRQAAEGQKAHYGQLTLPRLALLTAALLSTPATIGFDAATKANDVRALAMIGALIALLVLLRLSLLFVERDQLDSERRSAQRALKQMAYHDGLTQLANRRSLYEALSEATAAADGTAAALLFIDLDGFKQVNDEHGHMVGDAVLTQVAARLRQAVREDDLVARHGGDEFVILLRRLPHEEARARSLQAADRVRAALAEPIQALTVTVELAGSIGVAVHPDDGETPDHLVRQADMRMYAQKRSAAARTEAA